MIDSKGSLHIVEGDGVSVLVVAWLLLTYVVVVKGGAVNAKEDDRNGTGLFLLVCYSIYFFVRVPLFLFLFSLFVVFFSWCLSSFPSFSKVSDDKKKALFYFDPWF